DAAAFGSSRAAGDDHAALAGGDLLGGVEGEADDVQRGSPLRRASRVSRARAERPEPPERRAPTAWASRTRIRS
ncbi:MAG TPA: hypothetical protein PLV77_07425, partial [Solirubrobacterales bacterium]|nr:hypothetical protein [Solirubrobacterales bacterium]